MPITGPDHAAHILNIAIQAGAKIMEIYATDFDIRNKADTSPVTAADQAAEALILEALAGDDGAGFPVVAEEAFAAGEIPDVSSSPFWLVDPLDGTKEFISRNGEFTVNIALIEGGKPVLGVVHCPAIGESYWGDGYGVFQRVGTDEPKVIQCREAPSNGLTAYVSRSHSTPEVDEFLADFTIADKISAGSSLKFCRIAAGRADVYPRMGRTMEWDTAAAHAVLAAAGGEVRNVTGQPLAYGKPGFENPHFVAAGPGVLPPLST